MNSSLMSQLKNARRVLTCPVVNIYEIGARQQLRDIVTGSPATYLREVDLPH
jgi:hypothetical protein